MSADLTRFELRAAEDEVKTDLEVTCLDCGTVVCDAEHGDSLAALVGVVGHHACPPAKGPKQPTQAAAQAMVAALIRHGGTCQLTAINVSGEPCREDAVAVRFDGLFIDLVCADHAERARDRRGTEVIYPEAPSGD